MQNHEHMRVLKSVSSPASQEAIKSLDAVHLLNQSRAYFPLLQFRNSRQCPTADTLDWAPIPNEHHSAREHREADPGSDCGVSKAIQFRG